jgi:hypothetical protein
MLLTANGKKFLNCQKKMAGFSREARKCLKSINTGGPKEKTLRSREKFYIICRKEKYRGIPVLFYMLGRSIITKKCKNGEYFGFFLLIKTLLFNTASSAAPQNPLCRRMLG